jgi:cytochrome c oxidase cbb3-type subunit 4
MDVNELRTIITTLSFIIFLGIVYWAYSGRQKSRFDEAANLPFADDDMQERTIQKNAAIEQESKDV